MENRTKILGIKRGRVAFFHKIMLIAMLHSTLIAPSQQLINDVYGPGRTNRSLIYNVNQQRVKNELEKSSGIEDIFKEKDRSSIILNQKEGSPLTRFEINSDIKGGIIGVSNTSPIDDSRDNLFKFYKKICQKTATKFI